MHELKIFETHEFGQVRTVELDGKPYFVGIDIAKALGYANAQDAIKKHCRWVAKCDVPHPQSKTKTLEVNVIPEGDLYRLISHSELSSAEKFESWVFDEVLPSIRKHGMYATDELLDNPDLLIQVATALKEEREKNQFLLNQTEQQIKVIEELQPKASYYDLILQCNDLISVTEIAKDYGMSARKFNQLLNSFGIQFYQSGRWFLYATYQGNGYATSKTQNYPKPDGTQGSKTHMYWTQKGRLFLYDLLKAKGYIPEIESERVTA